MSLSRDGLIPRGRKKISLPQLIDDNEIIVHAEFYENVFVAVVRATWCCSQHISSPLLRKWETNLVELAKYLAKDEHEPEISIEIIRILFRLIRFRVNCNLQAFKVSQKSCWFQQKSGNSNQTSLSRSYCSRRFIENNVFHVCDSNYIIVRCEMIGGRENHSYFFIRTTRRRMVRIANDYNPSEIKHYAM